MYDLIVIGGGPAGLSAAIHAIRKRLDVLLIAKSLGGKTNARLQLPNVEQHLVITGGALVDQFVAEMTYLNFMQVAATVEQVQPRSEGYQILARDRQNQRCAYDARTVIVATGVAPRRLNIPGEQQYWMRGLSYSTVTYAQLFIDRTAIVVGDSALALLSTMELALIAQQVILAAPSSVSLETPLGQRLRSLKQVRILENCTPKQVKGDGYARSLVVEQQGESLELKADGIFVELGIEPRSAIVADLAVCEPGGWISVDTYNRTAAPGLFAAGDVTNIHTEQVLIAMGEGAKAALAAQQYLLNQSPDR